MHTGFENPPQINFVDPETGEPVAIEDLRFELTEKGKIALQRIEDELDPNVEVV